MADTQDKQKYLCDNILQKGYDAEDFAEFCQKLMGNIDIESWTYEQLQQIVAKYIENKEGNIHAEHEASFVDYQQEGGDEELPEPGMHEPQPQPVYEQPSMMKKKDTPTRESIQREEFTPSKEKKHEVDVDELFKDPFSKTKSNFGMSSTWNNAGWPGTKPSPPPAAKPDFNFTELLGPSPGSTVSSASKAPVNVFSQSPPQQIKSPVRAPAQVMKPVVPTFKPQVRPVESFQPRKPEPPKFDNVFGHPQQSNIRTSNFQPPQLPQSYVKKSVGNLDIFEMTIDDHPPVSKLPPTLSVITNLSGIPIAPSPQQSSRNQSNSMTQLPPNSQISNTQRSKSQTRSKIKVQGEKVIQDEFYDIIPCAKAHTRPLLSTPSLQFTITGHQIVSRNFFVPDYVLYHILTKGLNITVKRKYNHFFRLRNLLSKFYPGFRVPYLQKNPWINQTDKQFIGKQKQMIEMFMNDLLLNSEFRNCRIVEEFLTLDYKKLKEKLNQYDKLVRLRCLEELCLLTGEVNIAYTDGHRVYAEGIGPFVEKLGHQMDKYKKLQEQLTHNYNSLIRTYGEISELLVGVEVLCKGFNSTVPFCQFYELQQTVNSLNQIYKQLSNSTKFDLKILESQFKPIFKFQRENILTIKQLLQLRNTFTTKYSALHDKSTNQPYTNNTKLTNYKLAAQQPSKHPIVLKYQNGYYNAQLVMENMRMFKDLSGKLQRKFQGIAAMYQNRKLEEVGFWARKKGGHVGVVVGNGVIG